VRRTDDKRLWRAISIAHVVAHKRDLMTLAVVALLVVAGLAALSVFAFEPRRLVRIVTGEVTTLNQNEHEWGTSGHVTVRLDDGRTVVVHGRARPQARIRLAETEHLGMWRRTTFSFCTNQC
jgi:hypothetical protein